MYNFIFALHYFFFKKYKVTTHRSLAASSVALTVFCQIFFVANIITFFSGVTFACKPFSNDYFTNKLYLLPLAFVYDYLFVLYFTHKRAIAIVNKYPKDYKVMTLKNVSLVFLIMIVPLLVGVYFLQHTH